MNNNDRFSLYEERGDLLERKAISEKYGVGWYLQPKLDEINEQIRVIETITPQAQKYYFQELETQAWQIEAQAQAADDRDWQDQITELRNQL